jgi:hypothetical protein
MAWLVEKKGAELPFLFELFQVIYWQSNFPLLLPNLIILELYLAIIFARFNYII